MKNLFENTQIAFSLKSDSELKRAYFLFKIISNKTLVSVGTKLTNFALKLNLPVQVLIRFTVFDHFCAGINEVESNEIIDKLFSKKLTSVLDFSVEAKEEEAEFDAVLNKTLQLIDFAKDKKAIPFAVFKPSGFGRIDLYEKVSLSQELSTTELQEWSRVEARFDAVCKAAFDNNVSILVDAEESWMQDAVDNLVLKMMQKYNQSKSIVFNTLQMYRWDRMEHLKSWLKIAQENRFFIGIKLVRGAYLEKENDRAIKLGYPTPICHSKQETDKNFDNAIQFIAENIDCISVFLGTHNEASTYLLMDLMANNQINPSDSRIWFGQLYGMSDTISFNLANENYNVAKYLPFGPIKDVMPYLIRRAQENTSVAGQTNRELFLIKSEIERREKIKI